MTSWLKKNSKANARVVEVFANLRNVCQAKEKRLLYQIDATHKKISHLYARILEVGKIQDDSSASIQDSEMEEDKGRRAQREENSHPVWRRPPWAHSSAVTMIFKSSNLTNTGVKLEAQQIILFGAILLG